MKVFLNVYDYPVDSFTLEDIKSLGFHGVRRDVAAPQEVGGILAEGNKYGLETVLLFNVEPGLCISWAEEVGASLPDGVMVEVGNEWDTKGIPPEKAKAAWLACLSHLGGNMITGGISSLGDKAILWMEEAFSPAFPNVGFHPYRTTKPPDEGVKSRIGLLRERTPGATLWNTECGWHTCRSKSGCFSSVQFSEEQVAAFLKEDIFYHEDAGVASYTVYQLNDGIKKCPAFEDHFGIRRVDGSWKPAAYILGGSVK